MSFQGFSKSIEEAIQEFVNQIAAANPVHNHQKMGDVLDGSVTKLGELGRCFADYRETLLDHPLVPGTGPEERVVNATGAVILLAWQLAQTYPQVVFDAAQAILGSSRDTVECMAANVFEDLSLLDWFDPRDPA